MVEERGRLLSLMLTAGEVSEMKMAPELAWRARAAGVKSLVGDKGFDGDRLRTLIRWLGMEPVIPFRKGRKNSVPVDKPLYRKRNCVERFIGRIKENRRLATRYEKTALNFCGFILLAAIKDWLRFIC